MFVCMVVVLIIVMFSVCMIACIRYLSVMQHNIDNEYECELTASMSGGSKDVGDWLNLNSIFDDTVNEFSKSIYNYTINGKYLTIIGETHDKSECGLINFDKLGEVNRNVLLVFEDTNNEKMDIEFKHPFAIHYKDPRFTFHYVDPNNKYKGEYDYWFDENRLKTEPNALPKNVTYYPSDHREIHCYNPIFAPYFNFYRNSNSVMKKDEIEGIPESFHPTIDDIKKSKHYNKNKDDAYYKALIDKYSYNSYKEFVDIIVNKCCKMNRLDAFHEITFDRHEDSNYLTTNVKGYFSKHKTNHYIGFINVVNDVYALNEVDKAINGNGVEQIIMYVGSFHLNIYNDFVASTYKLNVKDDVYDGYEEPRVQKFLKSIEQ